MLSSEFQSLGHRISILPGQLSGTVQVSNSVCSTYSKHSVCCPVSHRSVRSAVQPLSCHLVLVGPKYSVKVTIRHISAGDTSDFRRESCSAVTSLVYPRTRVCPLVSLYLSGLPHPPQHFFLVTLITYTCLQSALYLLYEPFMH